MEAVLLAQPEPDIRSAGLAAELGHDTHRPIEEP